MPITAQDAAAKWASRLKGATQEIRQGVESTDINPMERAADAADKYLNRVQESVNNGKYAARLRAVPLETWRRATIDKGIPRIASGVDAAEDDVEDFFTDLFNYQAPLKRQIESMPDTTLEDSIARMSTWAREMANYTRS